MTPEQIRALRDRHQLSLRQLAKILHLEEGARRHLRAIVAGQREPSAELVARLRLIELMTSEEVEALKE